jgi:hypothetical protein
MQTDAAVVTSGDITIDSNHENADQIQLAFADEAQPTAPDASLETATEPTEPTAEDATEPTPVAVAPEADADAPVTSKARRRSATAAVQSAVTKQREAERRADMAEARLDALAQPAPTPEQPPAAPTPDWARFKAMAAAPKADQFESYDDYTAALATFVTDARQHEHETRRQQYYEGQAKKDAHDARTAQWQERLAKARTDIPDLDATLDPDVPMSLPMQYLAMESPVGVQLLQHLSSHPDESQRLSTLHPAEVYREMGKLEERFSAASTPSGPARVISHAKPPITPLGSSPHTPDATEISDDLSFDEHFKRMNAADRKRGLL